MMSIHRSIRRGHHRGSGRATKGGIETLARIFTEAAFIALLLMRRYSATSIHHMEAEAEDQANRQARRANRPKRETKVRKQGRVQYTRVVSRVNIDNAAQHSTEAVTWMLNGGTRYLNTKISSILALWPLSRRHQRDP